jgi:GBP family porin
MKKSLLALATLGAFAGAAQAQSSVSVYGIYDGGFRDTKVKTTASGAQTTSRTGDMTGSGQAASRLGFRGVEDLGGGMAARFNLELGINAGTGAIDTDTAIQTGVAAQGTTNVRTSTVGLTDKQLGSIDIGRQLSNMHTIVAGTIFAASALPGDLNANFAGGTGYATSGRIHGNAQRMNGSVKYTSPTIAGFTALVDYSNSASNVANTALQVNNLGLGAAYATGPFTLRAGWHAVKGNSQLTSSTSATTNAVTTATGTAIAETKIKAASARYSAKGLTAELIYGDNKVETAGAQNSKSQETLLGVSYAVGKFTPFIKYSQGKTETGANGAANADTVGMQLGSTYALSKRTSLYAAYGSESFKVKSSTTTVVGNKTEHQIAVAGLTHTF